MNFKCVIFLTVLLSIAHALDLEHSRRRREAQAIMQNTNDNNNNAQEASKTQGQTTVNQKTSNDGEEAAKRNNDAAITAQNNRTELILEKLENVDNTKYADTPEELVKMVNEFSQLFDLEADHKAKVNNIQRSRFIVPDTENKALVTQQ